jgi:hypothetical protein
VEGRGLFKISEGTKLVFEYSNQQQEDSHYDGRRILAQSREARKGSLLNSNEGKDRSRIMWRRQTRKITQQIRFYLKGYQ